LNGSKVGKFQRGVRRRYGTALEKKAARKPRLDMLHKIIEKREAYRRVAISLSKKKLILERIATHNIGKSIDFRET